MKNAAPADTSIRTPDAVARNASKADEIQKAFIAQMNGGGEPTPPEPDPTPEPAPQPSPESEPEIIPPPKPAEPAPPAAEDDWKRKFERSQGQLAAQQRVNRELNDRIDGLERVLATMEAQPAPAPAPAPSQKLITDADLETYGPEFFDAVERKAQELIAPLKSELEAKITQLGSQVGGVQKVVQRDAREVMHTRITQEVPNWLDLNKDQDFIDWLQEFDPLTGAQRHAMLQDAYGKNDGPRVANFFKAFLKEQEVVAEPSKDSASQPPPAPVVPLGAFAAPGKAKGTQAPSGEPAKQMISQRDIAAFYADVAAGKYHNRQEEKAKLERELFAAQAEGRIVAA